MLYDPKWQKPETKPDVFSLESLIAWLEKQPKNREYDYHCNGVCMLSQYFTNAGFENVHMWTAGFWYGPQPCPRDVGQDEAIDAGLMTDLPKHFNHIAYATPNTFGAALSRARAALACSVPSPELTKCAD